MAKTTSPEMASMRFPLPSLPVLLLHLNSNTYLHFNGLIRIRIPVSS